MSNMSNMLAIVLKGSKLTVALGPLAPGFSEWPPFIEHLNFLNLLDINVRATGFWFEPRPPPPPSPQGFKSEGP